MLRNLSLLIICVFLITLKSNARTVIASSYGFNATDATTNLRNAFNQTADTLIIDAQASAWIINPIKVTNKSNYTVILQPGVVLRSKTGYTFYQKVLDFSLCSNIKVIGYGATIELLRDEYVDESEFRHCLQLSGVNGGEVYGLLLRNSGGDGLNIAPGGVELLTPSRNITVRDCVMDNNKRQGISVTCAENVLIDRCLLQNTNGRPPAAGIDIEPFRPTHIVKNITIRNCNIKNNYGYGVMIIMGESQTLDNSVTVENTVIENCARGGLIVGDGFYGHEQGTNPDGTEVQDKFLSNGVYIFKNVWIKNIPGPAAIVNKPADSSLVYFKNCVFENANNNTSNPTFFNRTENTAFFPNTTPPRRIGPIFVSSFIYPNTLPNQETTNNTDYNAIAADVKYGGIDFENCVVIDDEARPYMSTFGAVFTENGTTYRQPLKDVTGNITVVNTAAASSTNLYNNIPAFFQNVSVAKSSLTAYPAATVNITAQDNESIEGGTNNGLFNVTRTGNNTYPLPISYEVTGTAVSSNDYRYLPTFVMIPAGLNTAYDTVIARQDNITEPIETVIATLNALPSLYTLGSNVDATVNIGATGPLSLNNSLIQFTAKVVGNNQVTLQFTVSQNTNAAYYTIERAGANNTTEYKANIPALQQLVANQQTYTSVDNSIFGNGNHVYRLYQHKQDGTKQWLGEALVQFGSNKNVSVWPNPNNGKQIWLQAKSINPNAQVQLISINGKQINAQIKRVGEGVWSIIPNSVLGESVYYVSVKDNNQIETYPIIMNH
jgi:hypothetical protein